MYCSGRRVVVSSYEARLTLLPASPNRLSAETMTRPFALCWLVLAALAAIPAGPVADDVVHFPPDLHPIPTKFGFNAGGCHGKASGQNGFKLSLFGFDAKFAHAAITHEARGRRIFPAAPERSLLLLKASGQAPHGGGKRLGKDGEEYKLLCR